MKFRNFLLSVSVFCSVILFSACNDSPSGVIEDYFQRWKNQEGSDVKEEMYGQIDAKVKTAVHEKFGERVQDAENDSELAQEIQEYEASIRAEETKKLDDMTDNDFTRIALERRRELQGCSVKIDKEEIKQSSVGEMAVVSFTLTYSQGGSKMVTEQGYANLVRGEKKWWTKGKWEIAKLGFGTKSASEVLSEYFQYWKKQGATDAKAEMTRQIDTKVKIAVMEKFSDVTEEELPDLEQEIKDSESEARAEATKELEEMTDEVFAKKAADHCRSMERKVSVKIDKEKVTSTALGSYAQIDFTITYSVEDGTETSGSGFAELVKEKNGEWEIATLEYDVCPAQEGEE